MTYTEKLREKLAAIEHERWADWQKYLHSKCLSDGFPGLVIPGDLVERWERQIATPYTNLSEAEKKSDMDQVDRYWPLIEEVISKHNTLLDEIKEWAEKNSFIPVLGGDEAWTGQPQKCITLSDLLAYIETKR